MKEVKNNVISIWVKNHMEFIMVYLVSICISLIVYLFCLKNVFLIYTGTELNNIFIGVFAVLLGLILTSYSIVFSIVPALNRDLLRSGTFLRINWLFFLSTLSILLLLMSSIIFNFISNEIINKVIIVFNVFLLSSVICFIILITIVLSLLFNISRKEVLEKD